MHKIYKAEGVTLGEKKKIDYIDYIENNIAKSSDEEVETSQSEEIILEEAMQKREEILQEANQQAQEITTNAENQYKNILEQANREKNELFRAAQEQGYTEGYEQGKLEGFQTVDELILEAKDIKQEAQSKRKELARELEKDLVDIIIESVKKIINDEISTHPDKIFSLIKKALEKCTFTERIVVRVSECDFELVNSLKNRIYMMTEGIDEIDVKIDASLSPKSVMIETLSGTIDASIEVQLKQIKETFEQILQSE